MSEAIAEFLDAASSTGTNTRRAYEHVLEVLYDHLSFKAKGSPFLDHFTRGNVEELVELLFAQGKRPATVAHRLDIWKACARFCHERYPGYLNHVRKITRPMIVNQGRKNFSPECVEKLRQVVRLNACRFLATRNALILELALRAGLREFEICGLTMNNFTDPGLITNVRRKGRKFFTIPTHRRIQETLDEYLQERDALLKIKLGRRQVTQEQLLKMPLLFAYSLAHCGPDEIKKLDPKTIYRVFISAGEAAGLKRCTPHMAKHSFTNDILKVADIATASRASGHSNISTTMQYLGRDLADLEKVLTAID